MESVVVWFIFIMTMFSRTIVYADFQVDALNAFKLKVTRDPKGITQSWDTGLGNPCTWFQITCDKANHVINIDLGGAELSGQLAPELGKLAYLQKLELYNNNFDGQIPEEIGYLSNLISLDLYNNRLSGPVPGSLANLVNLKNFRIDHNQLTGPIPLALPCLNISEINVAQNAGLCGPYTARCIDPNDPTKCTEFYECPCRCGITYTTRCNVLKTHLKDSFCCHQ